MQIARHLVGRARGLKMAWNSDITAKPNEKPGKRSKGVLPIDKSFGIGLCESVIYYKNMSLLAKWLRRAPHTRSSAFRLKREHRPLGSQWISTPSTDVRAGPPRALFSDLCRPERINAVPLRYGAAMISTLRAFRDRVE